jgi:dTDP-4-dehydrorhamnose reductase
MAEMRWTARRPRDSSLDTSLARRLLKVPFWDLSAALERFKEEFVGRHASG